MKIQLANIKDLDKVNELLYLSKSYWGYDNEFMEKFMKEYKITKSYIKKEQTFIIINQNDIIGFYSFSNNYLELDNLFLHPNYIGTGKGKEVWKLCLETARKNKIKKFSIMSDPNAEGFYLKMGCQKIGEKLSKMNRFTPLLKYIINE